MASPQPLAIIMKTKLSTYNLSNLLSTKLQAMDLGSAVKTLSSAVSFS